MNVYEMRKSVTGICPVLVQPTAHSSYLCYLIILIKVIKGFIFCLSSFLSLWMLTWRNKEQRTSKQFPQPKFKLLPTPRVRKSVSETENFWIFLSFLSLPLRNVGIFRLQVGEVRLLWLCSFNIHYFMMKEIIKESCDVSMHNKIALNPRINVHKPCISFFHSSIYILFMSVVRKWERY